MRKHKVYSLNDAESLGRALRRKPKSIWIRTEQGDVRILNPRLEISGWSWGVAGDVEVQMPRYCATVKNYQE